MTASITSRSWVPRSGRRRTLVRSVGVSWSGMASWWQAPAAATRRIRLGSPAMSILVTGTIDFDPAKRDDAVAAVTKCMEATQAEEGCERYVFSGDLSDPGRLYVSEQWASQEAMDTHMATPHLAELMG